MAALLPGTKSCHLTGLENDFVLPAAQQGCGRKAAAGCRQSKGFAVFPDYSPPSAR
jgi:hypothetical protein